MASPCVPPLSILAWAEIGKRGIALPVHDLSALSSPDALGAHWPAMDSQSEAMEFFAAHQSDALVGTVTGALAGGVGHRIDPDGAWIYYFLLPAWRGVGLGRIALDLAISRADELWPGRPISARCAETNPASLRLLRAAGFMPLPGAPSRDGSLLLRRETAP